MRIGELARRVGLSIDAIRFSERDGLLPKPDRHENGRPLLRSRPSEHAATPRLRS